MYLFGLYKPLSNFSFYINIFKIDPNLSLSFTIYGFFYLIICVFDNVFLFF